MITPTVEVAKAYTNRPGILIDMEGASLASNNEVRAVVRRTTDGQYAIIYMKPLKSGAYAVVKLFLNLDNARGYLAAMGR